MFVQFVALCYRCFIARKIKAVKEQLCLPREGLTQKQMDLEKNLKSWLEQRSMAQIFDWFDCIETTSVKTAVGMRRWTTESVARDRLFLALLGVNQ